MSVTPNLRLWSVISNVSSIVFELAKTDTKNKEVPSFYNFEQTVRHPSVHRKEKNMKKYLTSNEIMEVVNELTKVENGELVHKTAVERYILKVGMVAQIVLDDMDKFKDCNEIYDYVVENDIDFDMEVNNYYMIDVLVKEELSATNVIRDFVKSMEVSMKDLPNTLNLEQTLTKFRDELK